ncbi:MAG: GWxTD domain-containing protein [Gemmatimonadales bacterium]
MHVMIRLLTLALVPAALCAQHDTTAPLPPATPPDPLAAASEAKLDSLYGPLIHLMRADERGRYGGLAVEGKRTYLRQFWQRRDPTPETARNEAMESFYARVATVNRMFREGGAAEIPGWRTDRGRIYLRYGAPDAVLSRPQPIATNPYEVWRYERRRQLKFVFFDLTRFGNYSLIWTNDRFEATRPDWRLLLGSEAIEDVLRF